MARTNVFRNGKIHVQRSMCETCIFRPGGFEGLAPGRVPQMVRDATANQGSIPCHETMYQHGVKHLVCRGFYNLRFKVPHQLLQIAERLGFIKFAGPHHVK